MTSLEENMSPQQTREKILESKKKAFVGELPDEI